MNNMNMNIMCKEMTKIMYEIKPFSVTTNGKFCDT